MNKNDQNTFEGLPSLHLKEKSSQKLEKELDELEEDFNPHMDTPAEDKSEVRKKEKEYAKLNSDERQEYITQNAPKMAEGDMISENGETLNFATAQNLDDLIDMIEKEGSIKNNVGQEIPAKAIINCIYDRLLNRNSEDKDWTKITLRHRLREMVYRFAEEYMETNEFKSLEGLDLEKPKTLEELTNTLLNFDAIPDSKGNMVTSETIVNYINHDRLDFLPSPIKHKVQYLKQLEGTNKKPFWKKSISKIKSFFGR